MTYYRKSGDEVAEAEALIHDLLPRYYGDVREAGVTFTVLAAFPEVDEEGFPVEEIGLRHKGYPAAAMIRVVSYKDRVKGNADVEITIDGYRWPEWSEDEHRAIIDHELRHIEIVRDREGKVKTDDAGRPKIKMQLHDLQFGWFHSIARRHGRNSIEVQQAMSLTTDDDLRRIYLPEGG